MFNLNSEPVRIAKTKCGKIVKVYNQISDWQTFIIGAKYPELWKTKHQLSNATDVVMNSLLINELELLEFIK